MPTELTLEYHKICNILAIAMFQYILITSVAQKYSHKNILEVHGLIQNFPDWCRHLHSSCVSAKHR